MMKYQDIHLADKTKWRQFVGLWQNGSYDAAINLLSDTELKDKIVNAEVLNAITSQVVHLEENDDPTFKDDIIKAKLPPRSVACIRISLVE